MLLCYWFCGRIIFTMKSRFYIQKSNTVWHHWCLKRLMYSVNNWCLLWFVRNLPYLVSFKFAILFATGFFELALTGHRWGASSLKKAAANNVNLVSDCKTLKKKNRIKWYCPTVKLPIPTWKYMTILPFFDKRKQVTKVPFLVKEQNVSVISTDVNGISWCT